jgi:allantoin racemase
MSAHLAERVRVAFVTSPYEGQERSTRFDAVRSRVTPDIELGILEIDDTAFISNITPGDVARLAPAFVEGYRRAEKQGYHAAVPLGMLDMAVDAGRCCVDIPILGPFESSLHLAALVGTRIGLVAYTDHYLPMLYGLVRQYGMADFVVGARALGVDPIDFMSHDATTLTASLLREARSLISQAAVDVLIPCGISLCPRLVSPEHLAAELGVPVIEGMGAPIHMAAACVRLGLHPSRRRWRRSGSP